MAQRDITDALRAQAHEFSNNLHVVSGLIDLGGMSEAVRSSKRRRGRRRRHRRLSRRHVADVADAAVPAHQVRYSAERGVAFRLPTRSLEVGRRPPPTT